MELTIFTYGHIDAMFYVLNGVAMLMNHGFTDAIIKAMCMIGTAYYGLKMAYDGAAGKHKQYLVKIAAMILVINGLLTPKTDMLIKDHVSKKFEKVDNLPLGFAVPVGIIELFGDSITDGFEQVFTGLKSANYRDYGMVFGARLIQEARNWRIRTPEFTLNMHNYLKRCVIRDAMIGYRYTVDDLFTSDNIWQLVSANPNSLRKVAMRSKNSSDLVSCKEAGTKYILPAFLPEIESIKNRNANSDFANAIDGDRILPRVSKVINNMFAKNIELAFGSYLGSNNSAADLIKQQMMMNGLSDIADEYGYARASMQQESNWRIAGDLAATYLPILLSVIKGLLYASFIFMVPLMLLAGGMNKYLNYLTIITSLQLWPALNSVLNMFIDIYSSHALNDIANGIVSFTTYSEVGNYADKIVVVASALQMGVPFLAFAVVQGGVSGFINLASNITSAGQSAASSIAGEIATGNLSLDNYSLGNMQVAMQSGFKTDWNQSYSSGASSFQHLDGTIERVLGDGQTLLQSGTGVTMSGGAVRYNLENSTQNQISQGLQNSESMLKSDQKAYSEAKHNSFSKTADYVAHLAQREHQGESFDYSSLGEEGKSLQQAVSQTKSLRESENRAWDNSAQVALKSSIGASFGSFFSLSAEGALSSTDTRNQTTGKDSSINRDNNVNNSYSNIIKAASNDVWAKENSIDQSYSENVRNSYEIQNRLEDQILKRQEEVESWHLAKTRLDSTGASQNKDMYHELEQKIVDNYRLSKKDAHDMIENHDPRVENVWNSAVSGRVSSLLNEVSSGRERLSGVQAQNELTAFSNQYEGRIIKNISEDIQKAAELEGFHINEPRNIIDQTSYKLQKTFNETINNTNAQYDSAKLDNEIEEDKLRSKVDLANGNYIKQYQKAYEEFINQKGNYEAKRTGSSVEGKEQDVNSKPQESANNISYNSDNNLKRK